VTRLHLALSGGGVAGLGHIPVIEALDDLGLRPAAIAATSSGALIGAAVAAGMTGAAIRAHAEALWAAPTLAARRLWRKSGLGGITRILTFDPLAAVEALLPAAVPGTFEELAIPLTVVATDFHARAEARFTGGALREALAASIAIPGVFRPMRLGGRVYADGLLTGNLPLSALPEGGFVIAVDVGTPPPDPGTDVPGGFGAVMGAMRIMMIGLTEQALAARPPDLLFRPAAAGFGALDLARAHEVLAADAGLRAVARGQIARALGLLASA
jgi:NTE family protein